MRPVKVSSYDEFVDTFSASPIRAALSMAMPGEAMTSPNGPTYASYAAKAWLKAGSAPATVVRVLGEEDDTACSTVALQAGPQRWIQMNIGKQTAALLVFLL
jgi:hypothetical protein